MVKCNRCGQCCFYLKNEKLTKCKYLEIKKGYTECKIYKERIGVIIDNTERGLIYCTHREKVDKKFKGCPYN